MNIESNKNFDYVVIKACSTGRSAFIRADDKAAINALRDEYGNKDLLVSSCFFEAPGYGVRRL